MLTQLIRATGPPAFQVYGKARPEKEWRIIDVYATMRRNRSSHWPLWRGVCTTWSAHIISVGCDFADRFLADPQTSEITREHPVYVVGGRFRNIQARLQQDAPVFPTEAEILAHEIGHTWQAIRLGLCYLPIVGALTLLGEGGHWWNHFENEASEQGLFGGLVS